MGRPRSDLRTRGPRDTRPLRPHVRDRMLWFLHASPEGVTIAEVLGFLLTRRPASRDTIARVLAELERDGLVETEAEPAWRRRARSLLASPVRRSLRGRPHVLFRPTRALHVLVRDLPVLGTTPTPALPLT